MRRKAVILVILILCLLAIISVTISVRRARSRNALAEYKAELRARGEKLTFQEAGYPFPLETNANLERFTALADQLRSKSTIPGAFDVMPFEAPGRALVTWAGRPPRLWSSVNQPSDLSWDALASDLESSARLLSDLRVELEHPPRYFGWNYTNPFGTNQPKSTFVQKRAVAQFLAADCLVALRQEQPGRARADLHALTQLAAVHRDDVTLVSAMIRVVVAGLGLDVTWEALPAPGWDDAGLSALQRDWEAMDLLQALETGLVGERMFGEQAFGIVREADLAQQQTLMSFGVRSSAGAGEQLIDRALTLYWRGHMDEDELFCLQYRQAQLDSLRRLRANAGGAMVRNEFRAQFRDLERMMGSPLGRYRHRFSAIAIPNAVRALESVIRIETQRRMTILAIALQRHHLQHAGYPGKLDELVPEFTSTVPLDPWSGRPFCYQASPAGGFRLYSVGEDGRDDGGDPTPARPSGAPFEIGHGRDAVWPTAIVPPDL